MGLLVGELHALVGRYLLMLQPDLFDWARTGDEDIHQSAGGLLPVRAGRHVSDADESLE